VNYSKAVAFNMGYNNYNSNRGITSYPRDMDMEDVGLYQQGWLQSKKDKLEILNNVRPFNTGDEYDT